MLIILLILPLLLHATARPTSFGPITPPTIAHDLLFGRQVHCDCTGVMQRTLFDIIRSCLLTIAACVYRAIHQNIPDPKATWGQRMWVRIKITVLALFAPEMMIWWAMKQWMAARVIRDRVNSNYPKLQWTLTHGHFLQMGGFIRSDNGRVILLRDLLAHLDNGHLDLSALRQVTKKEIDDHSKGDILSKALVTLQTTWFVFECITRWQQKLLLTELEVVTLAFAVLNMLTYAFWWHKPLDVLCPIKLEIHDIPIVQPSSEDRQEQDGTKDDVGDTELTRLVSGRSVEPLPEKTPEIGMVNRALTFLSDIARGIKAAFREWTSGIAEEFDDGWMDAIIAALGIPIEAFFNRLTKLFETARLGEDATHVPTFYAAELEERDWDIVLYVCCFIGMIFGGIHFLSWNSRFPTHTQSLLWKASSVVLVIQPFLVALVNIAAKLSFNTDFVGTIVGTAVIMFGFVSSILGPIAYFLARSCLLVLAFLTLHHLTSDVFETVSWTSYIPHL